MLMEMREIFAENSIPLRLILRTLTLFEATRDLELPAVSNTPPLKLASYIHRKVCTFHRMQIIISDTFAKGPKLTWMTSKDELNSERSLENLRVLFMVPRAGSSI